MRPRSSLARHVASTTTTEDLDAMRLRAWRQQGVAVLRPEEIQDPWLRQGLINEAERRFGRRKELRR